MLLFNFYDGFYLNIMVFECFSYGLFIDGILRENDILDNYYGVFLIFLLCKVLWGWFKDVYILFLVVIKIFFLYD